MNDCGHTVHWRVEVQWMPESGALTPSTSLPILFPDVTLAVHGSNELLREYGCSAKVMPQLSGSDTHYRVVYGMRPGRDMPEFVFYVFRDGDDLTAIIKRIRQRAQDALAFADMVDTIDSTTEEPPQ